MHTPFWPASSLRLCLSFCLALGTLILPTAVRSAEPVTVQSYNIRYLNKSDGEDVWGKRSQAVIKSIQEADLVGLQEVVAQQLNDVQSGTPDFEWYGAGRDDGKEKGEMTPIGWRTSVFKATDKGTFWLSENPQEVGKKSWDAALPRVASWVRLTRTHDQARLLFVNTHFDHIGKEARKNSAALIRSWIAKNRGDTPVILVGDLNAELGSEPLDALLKPGSDPSSVLLDAIRISATKASGPNSTWNGFREIAEGRRIDHVLVIGDVKVATYTTLDPRTPEGRFASDHLPIQVDIEFE